MWLWVARRAGGRAGYVERSCFGGTVGCIDGRRGEGRERGLWMRHGFLNLASRGGAM